jgi:hypothetical protein
VGIESFPPYRGAPQGIPFGTEVFGAMQTYGGTLLGVIALAPRLAPRHAELQPRQ